MITNRNFQRNCQNLNNAIIQVFCKTQKERGSVRENKWFVLSLYSLNTCAPVPQLLSTPKILGSSLILANGYTL